MHELINKYKLMSKPAKASLWFVVSNVMLKGISLITLPIFSRLLTTSEYGIVSVYQSWVSTISIITTLTVWGGGFNVGMVKYEERQKQLISAFQGLATTLTIICLVLAWKFIPNLSAWLGISEQLIVLMFMEILVQIPFNIWSTEQRYKFEYKKLILVTIAISVLNPCLGILAVLNTVKYRAEARIFSNFLIQAVIGVVLFIHNQKNGRAYFSKDIWKFGFLFNVVLIPHYLSSQILNQADRIMINSMCGSGDAGIYSVAYNFAMLMTLVTNGINSSLTPHVYQCLKEKKTKQLSKQTTGIFFLVALMTAGLICIVPDVFYFLLPASYHPSLGVIPPVAVGAFFLFLYPLFGSIEFYYEENKYVTLSSVLGAVLNVILNYVFIKMFGYLAAAYTTLICYIFFSLFHYFCMKKVLKKHGENQNIYDTKKILLISIGLLIVMVVMICVYDHRLIRWLLIGVIAVGCFAKRNWMIKLLKGVRK